MEEFIRRKQMIASGDKIVVGVSGGADSMCLLDLLCQLAPTMNFSIVAVHVNHMLRGKEASRDEEFVKKFCKERKIMLKCVHVDVKKLAEDFGESLEEAGRRARYQAFASVEGVDKIAVAHHGDDQAETVLYNMFRGSSIRGAGGIRPVRNEIIRPLLCVLRKDIEEYLKERGIEYCTDSTNLLSEYTRNKIRNVVIPYIRENVNENVTDNINELSLDMQEAYEYIQNQAQKVYEKCLIKDNVKDGRICLNATELKGEPSLIRREVIMFALKSVSGTLKDITRKHVNGVEQLLSKQGFKRQNLPYGITVIKGYDKLSFLKEGWENFTEEDNLFLKLTEKDFDLQVLEYDGDWQKITNDYTKVFDCDKIKGNVVLRRRLPGDYITLDKAGKRKSLKTYFIDEKVPREHRDKIWVLAEGSHVLWIVGYRISAAYKTDEDTKQVLMAAIRRNQNGI